MLGCPPDRAWRGQVGGRHARVVHTVAISPLATRSSVRLYRHLHLWLGWLSGTKDANVTPSTLYAELLIFIWQQLDKHL